MNAWIITLGFLQIALLAVLTVALVRLKNTGLGLVRRATVRVPAVRRFALTGQAILPLVERGTRIARTLEATVRRVATFARSLLAGRTR